MILELNEEQRAVRDAARDFAQNVLKPGVIDRDNEQRFPADEGSLVNWAFGLMVDPKYGGSGMDTVSYVLAMEELSKIDASASVCVSVNNSLVCWGLETYGTEEQKEKFLKPLAIGEKIGAFCLSEPEAGSDATSQRTTAIDMGDHYSSTAPGIGSPTGIRQHLPGDGPDRCRQGHRGINRLVVNAQVECIVGAKEDKMGIRGKDTPPDVPDVKVLKENRIEDGSASNSPRRPSPRPHRHRRLPSASRRARWNSPSLIPRSARPSARRSTSTRPSPSNWRTWPLRWKPPACSV